MARFKQTRTSPSSAARSIVGDARRRSEESAASAGRSPQPQPRANPPPRRRRRMRPGKCRAAITCQGFHDFLIRSISHPFHPHTIRSKYRRKGPEGDPSLPELDRPADPPPPLRPSRPRDPIQHDPAALPVAGHRHPRPAGGRRGASHRPLRGLQPLRHPWQARHDHAQGYAAGEAYQGFQPGVKE